MSSSPVHYPSFNSSKSSVRLVSVGCNQFPQKSRTNDPGQQNNLGFRIPTTDSTHEMDRSLWNNLDTRRNRWHGDGPNPSIGGGRGGLQRLTEKGRGGGKI